MKKRVVITGLGVVSPIGIGKQASWDSLIRGASGIDTFARLNPDHLPVRVGAEVKNFDPKQFIKDRKTIRLTFLNVHLALAAAQLAVEDSRLDVTTMDPTRFGAVIGSGGGGFDDGPGVADLTEPLLKSWDEKEQRFDSARFGEKGVPAAYPLYLLKALPNNAFYYISLQYNIQGENDNIVSSYTGGAQAVGDGFRAIRRGLADVIIAGGYDSLLTPNTIYGLDSFGLLTRNANPAEACRPFDCRRDGMVAGEGAGFVILEDLAHAEKRGATIYAEVAGYGNNSSAYHIYTPDPAGSGVARAAARALQDAGLKPGNVDWICPDGISTPDSDRAEARALQAVFEDRLADIPMSATKSVTGHMGSGAGGAETVYSIMAITEGLLPPTANFTHPDEGSRLNIVTGEAIKQKIDIALNINQGIGGQSTALIFKRL